MNSLRQGCGPTQRKGASALLWWGVGTLILGSGPLALFILGDAIGLTKNSNPIGPGLLAFFTFWPGVALTAVGAVITLRRRTSAV